MFSFWCLLSQLGLCGCGCSPSACTPCGKTCTPSVKAELAANAAVKKGVRRCYVLPACLRCRHSAHNCVTGAQLHHTVQVRSKLAEAAAAAGEHSDAEQHLQRCLEAAEAAADAAAQAACHHQLGLLAQAQGSHEAAIEMQHKFLQLCSEVRCCRCLQLILRAVML